MSHVDDPTHDFDGLDKLDEKTRETIRHARIEARAIIDRLEPYHIRGWPNLIEILEDALSTARTNSKLFS